MDRNGSLYELAVRAAGPVLRLAAPASPKLRRALRGRGGAVAELERWASASRDPVRPLFWLHAPSVGEALMAQAITDALRRARPDVQLAFTFFSPSAERVAARVGADVAAYLPWDTRANAGAVLAALRPSAIGFVRTEIWPGVVRAAAAAGVPSALVNGVLGPGSSRLRGVGRRVLAPAYARLAAVGAVSDADAARFPLLGVARARIEVTGDARFDQVHARVAAIDRDAPLLARLSDGVPTLVAGSTWPADESRLIPAFAALRTRYRFRLIVAPHEPTAPGLAGVERTLGRAGFDSARLGAVERRAGGLPDAVVVDRVGVLADLYAIAAAAYVGGGFGSAGLHSIVEPAALGVPAVYGPAFGNAQEAEGLAAAGGGIIAADGAAIGAAFGRWLASAATLDQASAAARTFVVSRLGGAEANARLLLALAGG